MDIRRIYQIGFFITLSLMIGFITLFVFKDASLRQQALDDGNKQTEQSKIKAMDQLLANDLSVTTSMFLDQLSIQMQRWSKANLSDPQLKKQFEKELAEHKHFEGFAILHNNEITTLVGNMTKEKVAKLEKNNSKRSFSHPYKNDDTYYMIMSESVDNEKTIVGEINLSFVRNFVKDIASIADATGAFFVSGGDTKMKWTKADDVPDGVAVTTVPDLNWKIVVQSEEEQDGRHYVEGDAVIKLKDEYKEKDWLQEHPTFTLVKDIHPYFIIHSEKLKTTELISMLEKREEIEFVEPNYIVSKQAVKHIPNDEFFKPYQWNLSQISVEEGWDFSSGAQDVTIAIIDTGVDPNHQDLHGKVLEGFNAIDGTKNSFDTHGHGTHVAGIAAALTNNVAGIAGIAWKNTILPVKVLDEKGEGSSFEVARGIRWAVDHGADVINMSLGDYHHSFILYDAVRYAYNRDVVMITASGNDGVNDPMYPAMYEEVLTVGAVNENRDVSFFSNYGHHIDVTAPGEQIPSTFPDDSYVVMSGTSMATPHVTGLAGLIRAIRPDLTNDEVYDVIRHSSVDLGLRGKDPHYGYGEINVANALRAIKEQNR